MDVQKGINYLKQFSMEYTNEKNYSEEELENSISYVIDFYCRKYASNKTARDAIAYLIREKVLKYISNWNKDKSTMVSYCSVVANTAIIDYMAITPVVRHTTNDEKLTILSIDDNEVKQLIYTEDISEHYDSVLIRNSLEQALLNNPSITYEELELLQLKFGIFDADKKRPLAIKNQTGKNWRTQEAMLLSIFKKLKEDEVIVALFKHLKL